MAHTHGITFVSDLTVFSPFQMAERPEDFNLPVSVVARLLKESLPEGVSVSKEARAALAKAAAIFVLYTTSLSNNFATKGS